ncbi:xaa-pro dipeptidase, partial [Lasius niger]
MESIEIRKEIAKHLALRNKLQAAAKEVEEIGHLFLRNVATKYGLDYEILDRKFNIVKRKEEFYEGKQKFDAARKEIIEGNSTFKNILNIYGIS